MTCAPNAFRTGDGLIRLEPGESTIAAWGITGSSVAIISPVVLIIRGGGHVESVRPRRCHDQWIGHRSGVGRGIPPDAFAVVGATCIVSIAARDHGYSLIDVPLAVIAVAAFAVLFAGFGLRLLTHPRSSFALAGRLDIVLRLFTFVAACAVLDARFDDHPAALWPLAVAATGAWLILVPLAVRAVSSRSRVELREHAHGAWLLASVVNSGLAITAADLATDTRWAG